VTWELDMREATERETLIEEICRAMRQAGRLPEKALLKRLPLEQLRKIHAHWALPKYVY
jgi:hypothetical protein